MNLGIQGELAVVTGASRGLGFAVAQALVREGARVVIAARTDAHLDGAAARLRATAPGAQVAAHRLDVLDQASIKAFAAAVRREHGDPRILVTNAGGPQPGGYDDVRSDDFVPALELCFLFAVRLFEEFLPAMRAAGFGRVVHIGSVSARQPLERLILSNASRAALLGYAKTVAGHVAKDGVTVNVVLPGFTRTDRTVELAAELAARQKCPPEQVYAAWEVQIPAGRLGRPEELADAVAFLCSRNASYVTGTTLAVDGGFIRGLP